MKIQIAHKSLRSAAARCSGLMSDRSLGQICLSVEDGILTVSGSDGVLAVYSTFECESMVPKSHCVVEAKFFCEIAQALPDGPVFLETQGNALCVKAGLSGEFSMKLPLIETTAWPKPPTVDSTNAAELEAEPLRYIISQTSFCLQPSETSRNYAGVGYLHRPSSSMLRIVTTDGYRLAASEYSVEGLPKDFLPAGVCLSKRVLTELDRLMAEGFASLRFVISSDHSTVKAEVPGCTLYARLSGSVKFPNYKTTIAATEGGRELKFPARRLQQVLGRVLLAAEKTNKPVRIHMSPDRVTFEARSGGTHEGKEELVPDVPTEGDLTLTVNGKYLQDVLSTTPSESVILRIVGPQTPVAMLPQGEPHGCRTVHVIVPIQER